MTNAFKMTFYNWNGNNHEFSQKLHLLIDNDQTFPIFKFFTEYIGHYKLFPIHLMVIILIMTINLFIQKNAISQEQLRVKATKNFQLISTVVITILCMAAAVGATKEIFSLTRPLCDPDFKLSEYALQYKHLLSKTKDMQNECKMSFPSGHSAYSAAMLTALWGWLTKPFKIIGILIVTIIALSRIALGMHFISDVVFAVLLSIFIALAVRHIMQAFFTRRNKKRARS